MKLKHRFEKSEIIHSGSNFISVNLRKKRKINTVPRDVYRMSYYLEIITKI